MTKRNKMMLLVAAALAGSAVLPACLRLDERRQQAEFEPVVAEYNRLRESWTQNFRYKIDSGPLTDEGLERLRVAARKASDSDGVIFVQVLPDYDAAISRGDKGWQLDPDLLLRTKPELDGKPISADMASRLMHWYGSVEVRKKYHSMMLSCEAVPRPNGTWFAETGMARVSGDGFHIVLSPTGELVSIQEVFTPD